MASVLRRRELPIILLAFTQIVILADYYFTQAGIQALATELRNWTVVVAAFATLLATFELLKQHWYSISRRLSGKWIYSIVLIISLVITFAVGMIWGKAHEYSTWIAFNVRTPAGWGMSGMILFYIFTSAWRAFRVRNVDSALLFLGCVLVCIGSAPYTAYLFPWTTDIKNWLTAYIQASVARAFNMTAAIGGIIFGVRVLLGLERRYVA